MDYILHGFALPTCFVCAAHRNNSLQSLESQYSKMNSALFLSSWGRKLAKDLMQGQHKFKPKWETHRWNIVKGDSVQVVNGPQTGQKGKVLHVLRKDNRIIVDGVNMRSRIIRPLADGTPGRKVLKPCSVHYSNVMLIDPTTK